MNGEWGTENKGKGMTMMEIFLGFLDVINDNRFWLGPILALVALVLAACEVIGVVQEEIEDARNMKSVFSRPRPWR